MAADQKKKKNYAPFENPVEQMKDVAHDLVEPVQGIFDEALQQIGLKARKEPLAGEINLSSGIHQTNEKINQKDASIDAKIRQLQYVHSQEKQVFNLSEKTTKDQIQKLMQELAIEVTKLQQQTSELTSEVKSITVASIPVKPGAYHLNYFEWVIGTLRDLRKRVNESRQWLAMWSKKKQQKGYWAMFKKHGTSFAMSDERSIAQAGG